VFAARAVARRPGHRHRAVLGGVGGFGFAQDGRHLGCQFSLALDHSVVAHGLVAAGVGSDLGAVESDPPELHETGLVTQGQDFDEERPKGDQVATAELPDRLVVRAGLTGEEHEVDIARKAFLDTAGTPHSCRVAVQENLEHHCRVIGRHAPWIVVGGEEGRKIERVDEIADEGRQAVGLDPITQRRRHQQEAVLVVWPEGLGAHTRFSHSGEAPVGD